MAKRKAKKPLTLLQALGLAVQLIERLEGDVPGSILVAIAAHAPKPFVPTPPCPKCGHYLTGHSGNFDYYNECMKAVGGCGWRSGKP